MLPVEVGGTHLELLAGREVRGLLGLVLNLEAPGRQCTKTGSTPSGGS